MSLLQARHAEKHRCEQNEGSNCARTTDRNRERRGFRIIYAGKKTPANDASHDDGSNLTGCRRNCQGEQSCRDGESKPFPIRAEALRHAPYRLRDDGDGDDLEAVQPCNMRYVSEAAHAVGEGDERERRRHGEAEPCRKSARQTGAQHAENDADLTARRPGQELAERDDIATGRFIEPLAALHEFGAEITQMRYRPAEARHPEPKEHPKHFQKGATPFG
jgi:hypothetical protein